MAGCGRSETMTAHSDNGVEVMTALDSAICFLGKKIRLLTSYQASDSCG